MAQIRDLVSGGKSPLSIIRLAIEESLPSAINWECFTCSAELFPC